MAADGNARRTRSASRRAARSGDAGAQPEKRVGIYVRISQDRGNDRMGVTDQQERCLAEAERLGMHVVGVYEDNDISASKGLRREKYKRLLADVESGRINVIMAKDWSRLTRTGREKEDIYDLAKTCPLDVHFLTGGGDINSADGRFVLDIHAANAQREAAKIGERVRERFEQKRALGHWLGGVRPFGWDVIYDPNGVDDLGKPLFKAGRLVVNRAEKDEVVRACRAVIKGASLGSIAADLNARGVKPSGQAGRWTTTTVRQVLLRPRNAGWLEYKGQLVGKGEWEPLVSQKIWRDVERLLDPVDGSQRHRTPRASNTRKHLLSGLALCGECGATMKSAKAPNRDGTTRTIYRCSAVDALTGRPVMGHPCRNALQIEQRVTEFVIQRLCTSNAESLLYPNVDAEQDQLSSQAREIEARIDDLSDAYRRGLVGIGPFTSTMAGLQSDLESIEARRAPATNALVLEDLVSTGSEESLRAAWSAMPLSRQREVINVLVTVKVFKSSRSGTRFDDETVVVEPK